MKLYTLITLMWVITLMGMEKKDTLENAMHAIKTSSIEETDSKNITDEMQQMYTLVKAVLENGRSEIDQYHTAIANEENFNEKKQASANWITKWYYRRHYSSLINKEKEKAEESLKKYQDIISDPKLQQFSMPNYMLLPKTITNEYVINLMAQNTKSVENAFMDS